MSLIQDLNWRYASKRMNGTKVHQDKVDTILEAINLAPTSLGLQAFRILVIENEELKEKIFKEACHQPPIRECSHLLVFTAYKELSEEMINEFLVRTASARNLSTEWSDKYKSTINFFKDKNKEKLQEWIGSQTYIALGVACVAAANERVDSTPIEGFDTEKMNNILNLDKRGLTATVLLPLGYRDESNDPLAKMPKVRRNIDDLVERL